MSTIMCSPTEICINVANQDKPTRICRNCPAPPLTSAAGVTGCLYNKGYNNITLWSISNRLHPPFREWSAMSQG